MYHFVYILFELNFIVYNYLYNIEERIEKMMKKKSIFANCFIATALLTSAGTIQLLYLFAGY